MKKHIYPLTLCITIISCMTLYKDVAASPDGTSASQAVEQKPICPKQLTPEMLEAMVNSPYDIMRNTTETVKIGKTLYSLKAPPNTLDNIRLRISDKTIIPADKQLHELDAEDKPMSGNIKVATNVIGELEEGESYIGRSAKEAQTTGALCTYKVKRGNQNIFKGDQVIRVSITPTK